ncbi:MAG TPA: translational GTPase TypA [bacterium]|nr:translational GTPase TypA [bacterium]
MTQRAQHIRNVAIIAHVDHGKTTLVDALIRQSGILGREVMAERVMDSMDLERERGITIAAKNCTVEWEGLTINIVDTPGHADFGGEVERILSMVDGALLLVDAAEGPLPQTRFVLRKALNAGLAIVVVVNKIDRSDARVAEVVDDLFSLFIDCDAQDHHLAAPVVYAVARDGVATMDLKVEPVDITPVFRAIRDYIPGPAVEADAPLSILVANLGYSDYVGRLAIGRIRSGVLTTGQEVQVMPEGREYRGKVTRLYGYHGLKQVERTKPAEAGDIVVVAGLPEITIGDTITVPENPRVQPRISVEEPTVTMVFGPNTSPMSGREGKFLTARHLRERLWREAERNVSLRISAGESADRFVVSGRGELQLAILIEQMRREGYEMEVGRPKVIEKVMDGQLCEPYEFVVIDVPEEFVGAVTERLSSRRGVMQNMHHADTGQRVRLEFRIPSRGLIGIRSAFLTETRGTGIMHAVFDSYGPHAGRVPSRTTGAIVADRAGKATAYAIENLESRGALFVGPSEEVYAGMVVGENAKEGDMLVYIGRPKKLTNMRSSTSDEAVVLVPPVRHTLESAMEWISDDELLEVTPTTIRIRKRLLDHNERKDDQRAARETEA